MDSRQAHFAAGVVGETQSLQNRANSFNTQVPRMFRANGLNQPFMMSPGNGNSMTDAQRQTPVGQLPSQNGSSLSTYNQKTPRFGQNLNI